MTHSTMEEWQQLTNLSKRMLAKDRAWWRIESIESTNRNSIKVWWASPKKNAVKDPEWMINVFFFFLSRFYELMWLNLYLSASITFKIMQLFQKLKTNEKHLNDALLGS